MKWLMSLRTAAIPKKFAEYLKTLVYQRVLGAAYVNNSKSEKTDEFTALYISVGNCASMSFETPATASVAVVRCPCLNGR
jgi:hypothetical protein